MTPNSRTSISEIGVIDRLLATGVSEEWRYGRCYAMASALTDLLAWPVVTLTVSTRSDRSPSGWREHVVHAWVRSPDGAGFDASGFFDESGVESAFLANAGTAWRDARLIEHADTEALLSHLAECFPEAADPVHRSQFDALCEQARDVAQEHLLHLAMPALTPA